MKRKEKAPVGRPPTITAPRKTILTHAARLFAERGFEQTSLEDVGRSVGVSKAAVYYYFPSKQDLYDEIAIGLLEGLYAHVRGVVGAAGPEEDPVALFMRAHAEYFEENFEGFATLLHGMGGLRAQMRSERQIRVRDQYETFLRDVLTQAAAAGRLRVDDPALTAKAILSMLNWMSRWYKPGGPRRAVEIAEYYYATLYRGLHTDP